MSATKTITKKKYIDSHWLVFVLKGALASIVGLGLILTVNSADRVATTVAFYMIALGIIELCNVLYRKRRQNDFGIPLTVSLIQILVALSLLASTSPEFVKYFTNRPYEVITGQLLALRLVILACYTIFAAVSSIVISFTCFKGSRTDRFIWLMEGMFGTVMGLVMLAENGLSASTYLHVFGVYSLVKGLTDMIYGVHSHSLQIEAEEAKANARTDTEKAKAKTKSAKKSKKASK